jgi:hypothetical protein
MLRRLTREIDLHEQLRIGAPRRCGSVETLKQADAVDGMDPGEVLGCSARLVRLQRTDQVPSDRKVGRSGHFL